MPYQFPPEIDRLVHEELAFGRYANEDEVLLAAMQALREQDETIAAIQEGLDDLEAGRVCPLATVDAELRAKYGITRDV